MTTTFIILGLRPLVADQPWRIDGDLTGGQYIHEEPCPAPRELQLYGPELLPI